jgi:hypothetical protein
VNDRIVPGWVLALAAGVVIAAGLLIVVAPRLRDFASATPAPTAVRSPSAGPSLGGTLPPNGSGPPASALASLDLARLGTIAFGRGRGSDRCSVTQPLPSGPGPIMTASSTDRLYVAAVLNHPVATSPGLRLLILGEGSPIDSISEPQDGASPQCWSRRATIGPLGAGNYIFVLLDGPAQEATGILNVTP